MPSPELSQPEMNNLPFIIAEITFHPREGEINPTVSGARYEGYMPHLVVQSPEVRQAAVENNEITDEHLGVRIVDSPFKYRLGESAWFTLVLLYEVNYNALIPEATFTVREGPIIVGYGKVLARGNSVEEAEKAVISN
ncbi:MAG: hypothetical protein H7308_14650 [Chthonomonadaceae bacterium]|nr:hypothetical protein [Chthonomonadaceae bacterium]